MAKAYPTATNVPAFTVQMTSPCKAEVYYGNAHKKTQKHDHNKR